MKRFIVIDLNNSQPQVYGVHLSDLVALYKDESLSEPAKLKELDGMLKGYEYVQGERISYVNGFMLS